MDNCLFMQWFCIIVDRKFRTNATLKNHLCKTAVQDAQPLISDCDESSQCVDDPTIEYSVRKLIIYSYPN